MMTYQEKITAVEAIAAAAPAIGTPASAPGGVLYYVVDIRPADANTCTLIGGPAPMARDRWKLTLASECGAITEASENIAASWIHRAAHHRAIGEIEAAAICKAKGHAVMTANFLMVAPKPEFDRVVMNPPFYGRHYVKHVRHALEFLKPGGVLVAVLPATAHYDHGELQGQWQDLPVASFADAGTNVPTGLLKIVKR